MDVSELSADVFVGRQSTLIAIKPISIIDEAKNERKKKREIVQSISLVYSNRSLRSNSTDQHSLHYLTNIYIIEIEYREILHYHNNIFLLLLLLFYVFPQAVRAANTERRVVVFPLLLSSFVSIICC
jgi:hypothetical protein